MRAARMPVVALASLATLAGASSPAAAWSHYDSSDDVVLRTGDVVPRLRLAVDQATGGGREVEVSGIEVRFGGWSTSGLGGGLVLGGYYSDVAADTGVAWRAVPLLATVGLDLLPTWRLHPYAYAGGGGLIVYVPGVRDTLLDSLDWVFTARAEGGLKLWLSRGVGLDLAAVYDRSESFSVGGLTGRPDGFTFRVGLSFSPSPTNIATSSSEELEAERRAIYEANHGAEVLQDSFERARKAGRLDALWRPAATSRVPFPTLTMDPGMPMEGETTFSIGPGIYRVRVSHDVRARVSLPSCAATFHVLREESGPSWHFLAVGNGEVEVRVEKDPLSPVVDAGLVVLERLDVEGWRAQSPPGEAPSIPDPLLGVIR